MYVVPLKVAFVEALRATFNDPSFPAPDFAKTKIDIEYPMTRQQYPGIWVTYDDRDALTIASIDHKEFVADTTGGLHEVTRWNFSGTVTLTAVALSSRERDNLYDQMVRIYTFGRVEGGAQSLFRETLDNNDLLVLRINWDEARPSGEGAAPGTPWGTDDEVIYDRSLSFDVEGDFLSDSSLGVLVALNRIEVEADLTNSDDEVVDIGNVLTDAATPAPLGQWF